MPDKYGENVWSKKRDLKLVWKDDVAVKHGFGPHNTLMIDSEYCKIRDFLDNSILLPPYTEEEVRFPTKSSLVSE